MKNRDFAHVRFELGGRTWLYTGTPNFDELAEAPWWTPRMTELSAVWFQEPCVGGYWDKKAGEILRAFVEGAGGRIIEAHSVRADGSIEWEDFKDNYVR